jgi:omega-6 fatty acid desaturase (delta-12 desaturase)
MREEIYRHIAKYANPSDIRGSVEFLGTFALWTLLFLTPWWLFPLHALVVIRLFVVGVHDTGHLSLFRSRWLNDAALRITSPIVWMPGFSVWRPGHNHHHRHSNDLDYNQGSQTASLTVTMFHSMPWWKRMLYRYATQPWVILTQTAPLGMTLGQLLQIATWDEGLFQILFILVMSWYGVLGRHILVSICSGTAGVFLFHLQHTFPECMRVKGRDMFENGYYGSSYLILPEFLKLFTGGIEYHHIHHLSSRVPSYHLRSCHEEAPPEMWNGIRMITLKEGWQFMSLTLWSESEKRLVSFDEFDSKRLLT